MSDEKVLTKEIAEQDCYWEDHEIVDFSEFTVLEDAAAEFISDAYNLNTYLDGLTSLSDAAAEALSKKRGRFESGQLSLKGLTSLSDAAAESLGKHKGSLRLDGLTEISDTAAESLSKHKGDLDLDGLTSLSDAAAESLSKYKGDLSFGLVSHANCLTSLPDAAAESFGKHKGYLRIWGLKNLSDAAAKSLSKHRLEKSWKREATDTVWINSLKRSGSGAGLSLHFSLKRLSDSPKHVALAERLSKINCDLRFSLTSLSDAAAESLSKHEGDLELRNLTSLSDAAAESLAKRKFKLKSEKIHLDWLPESAAKIIRDAGAGW